MAAGLHLHVGKDLERLTQRLAELLAVAPRAVLDADWMVIPSAAVRQWLDWSLSTRSGTSSPDRRDGVTANLRYLFPEEFVRTIESDALEQIDRTRVGWDVETLTLRLLQQRDRAPYQQSRRLAQEIDEVVRWRSDFVRHRASAPAVARDALAALDRISGAERSPLTQRQHVLNSIREQSHPSWPERVFIFGLPNVPGGRDFVALTRELAGQAEVHVLIPTVEVERARVVVEGIQIVDEPSPIERWTIESRETLELWREGDPSTTSWEFLDEPSPAPTNVLSSLQHWLRSRNAHDVAPDDSVKIIGCVGHQRQAEICRDQIFDAIVRDGLRPEDVLVVTPDPQLFAHALERHWHHEQNDAAANGPRLAYEMVEVAASSTADRLAASRIFLDIVDNYITIEQLETLCACSAVARACNLSAQQWDRFWRLCDAAPVTFGVSPAQRDQFAVYGTSARSTLRRDAGSWQRLIDRVVNAHVYGGDVDSLGVPEDLEIVAALHHLLRVLDRVALDPSRASERRISQWLDDLSIWMQEIAPPGKLQDESFERAVASARSRLVLLGDVDDVVDPEVPFEEFATWWRDLSTTTSHQRVFGRGGVTVARLTALPFAPYEMICVVGFDEDALPSANVASAVLGERRVGDPDARRAILAATLAAICSARRRLVITWNERDQDTGRERDAPIPLEELIASIKEATGVSASGVQRRSARHGFRVPRNDDAVISDTYDTRYDVDVAVNSVPTSWLVARSDDSDEDASSLAFEQLRSFAEHPGRHFVRSTLRAALPDLAPIDATIPPVAISELHRFSLQKEYVSALAEQFTLLALDGTLPTFSSYDHAADPLCAGQPCEWLHSLAWRLRNDIMSDESKNRAVPTRFWERRLRLDILDLAAYNYALDATEYTSCSTYDDEMLRRNIVANGPTLITFDAAHESRRPWPTVRRNDGALGVLNFETRSLRTYDWRNTLRDVLDLLVLRLNGGEEAFVTTYFLPDRSEPYNRKQDNLARGDFALNPTVTMIYTGSALDAQHALDVLVSLYQRARHEALPLFRRTSVAAVASGLRRSARGNWTTQFRQRGEDREILNELLFPLDFDALAAFEPETTFPLTRELCEVFDKVKYTMASQSQRSPSQRHRELLGAQWSGEIPELIFHPLIAATTP